MTVKIHYNKIEFICFLRFMLFLALCIRNVENWSIESVKILVEN